MKYLRQNIQLLFAFILVLGFFSCTDEDTVGNGGKEIREGLPTTVSLKLTSATPMVVETKTEDSNGKFGRIDDLAILVYDADKEKLDKVTVPESNLGGIEWDGTFQATTGSRRIYVLANFGLSEDKIRAAYDDENMLKKSFNELISAVEPEPTVPKGNEKMIGFVQEAEYKWEETFTTTSALIVISESVDESTPAISLCSRLYPPYSKITFTVKNEVTDIKKQVLLDIEKVSIRNSPTAYSLLPKVECIGVDNVDKNAKQLDKEEDGKYIFYMYENLQGDHNPSNEDSRFKNPFSQPYSQIEAADWDSKWAGATPCTYIEIEGSFKIWQGDENKGYTVGSGPIHYRFFLGEDIIKNFDVKRNTSYEVTLAFTGLAGYDEIQYEWRVNAELEHATFVPEGSLSIDGSKGYFFPFYVINKTNKPVSFTTEGYALADMNILYGWDDYNDYATSVPSIKQTAVSGNTYKEYGVGPYNLGIIGHTGHIKDSWDNDSEMNAYRYYGATTVNADGDNIAPGDRVEKYSYNTLLRAQVVAGEIYRTRVYSMALSDGNVTKLTVTEYPLLCLSEKTGTQDTETVYAQRIDHVDRDVKSSSVSYEVARRICFKAAPVEGRLHVKLPSPQQFQKLIQLETGPLKPDNNRAYWCNDGNLYNWDGTRSNLNQGYVRCVYSCDGGDNI